MLEKLWGLPAHPVYVHFPVALFTLASLLVGLHLLDRGSRFISHFLKKIRLGDFDIESFSFFCNFLGVGMSIVAILSGLELVEGWEHLPFPHGPLALGTVSCYFVLLVIRWVFGPSIYGKPRLKYLFYCLHLLGLILVSLTGFAGGELHYN